MGLKLKIHIGKGVDIGGDNIGRVNPFVVVCFDEHIDDEMYKSKSAGPGREHVWNESFTIDFTHEMKNALAAGYPEPTYITFNVFDANQPDVPSIGSAGVLISSIQEDGFAAGDFPVVNGTGFLTLAVGDPPKQGWIHSPAAKKAGLATAAGAAVLAIGLTARHYRNKKKGNGQQQGQGPGRVDNGASFSPGPSSSTY